MTFQKLSANSPMNPDVAIIILNRNQTAYTRDCLVSLAAIDYSTYRTVVVDNDSTDDSLHEMARDFPTVDFIFLKKNAGVAGGRNAGLRDVLPDCPEFVLFLDNDTLVAPDFLSRLVEKMQSDSRIGAIQPKIYFSNPPDQICSVGGRYYPRISHFRHPASGQNDGARFQRAVEIDTVMGCAGLMRSRVFQEVGLLDETFSPYGPEDVDWSLRLRDAGYRLVMEPTAKVWHRVSSPSQANLEKTKHLASGYALFLRIHTRWWDFPLSIAWVVFHLTRRFLLPVMVRGEWSLATATFQGIREGLRRKRHPIEFVPSPPTCR